ncbi:hypothetical protein D3C81_1363890 [compost metagenome]
MNSIVPAFGHKFLIFLHVKEHLSYNKLRTHIHFLLQIFKISIEIRRFKMLLRVSCDTNTKIGLFGCDNIFVEILSFIHIRYLFQ